MDANGTLTLHAGSVRIPIEGTTQLTAGQTVNIEVVKTDQGLQLKLTTLPESSQGISTFLTQNLASMLASVLEGMGADIAPDLAAQFLPSAMPPLDSAIRQILSLFIGRNVMGSDLQEIANAINQASEAGILAPGQAQDISSLLARLLVTNPSQLQEAMSQIAGTSAGGVEARIALALAAGTLGRLAGQLKNDLRTQLVRLKNNESLLRFLDGTGQASRFMEAIDGVLDRLAGIQLQNIRGLEQPYVFFEVPFGPGSGLKRAQVHVFGDGKGRRFDPKNASLALDISTTVLGDLWIHIQVVHGRLTCRFKASNESAVAEIEREADELVKSLAEAGYPGAKITATHWDGNRLNEAGALMRRFTGINMQA